MNSPPVPEVSVILPTCDRPHLVRRALASVVRQTFADLEILLVDANRASPPVAANPALADLLRDPRVRVVDARATRNASMSRNAGLATARGRWITFLDDDDEYRPEKIAAQLALATATDSRLVLCGLEFVWPRRRRQRQIRQEVFHGDEIVTHAIFNTPLLFHRRDASIRFDETLRTGHDLTYALEFVLRHQLPLLRSVPRPLVVFHPQPAALSVHGDREAAWIGWRAAWRLARRRFSRRACRSLLAFGRLERANAGYGTTAHFLRCLRDIVRLRGLREWRLVAFSLLTRLRWR